MTFSARRTRKPSCGDAAARDAFPRSSVLRALLSDQDDGTVTVTLEFPDGTSQDLSASGPSDARVELVAAARRFLNHEGHRFGRLAVAHGEREWELALPADLTQDPVVLFETRRSHSNGNAHSAIADIDPDGIELPEADTPVPAQGSRRDLDRVAFPLDRPRRSSRPGGRTSRLLKGAARCREDDLDTELARRWVVHDTNCIVVASSKGGVGKTTNTVQVGSALAACLPNQRVCAVDFNVGGGALQAAVAEDRAAQHTLFELHRDRALISRHSHLQPYLSSLPTGLDLLTVPPQPELALEITPEHYAQLFDEVLLDAYDVLVLDCSPDITNPVTTWALGRGTQLIISTEQGYLAGVVVQHALDYLLAQPAAGGGARAIGVINKVVHDPRAGSADETERALRSIVPELPVVQIPADLDLRALLDSGTYGLEQVRRRATRVAIKQLSLEVCRRLT